VIVGAGAIGAGMGARLHQAGREVVLVARGEHLRAMRSTGLRMRTPGEDVRFAVTAIAGPDELALTPDDVLIMATKTHQLVEPLAQWADAPVTGGGTAGEVLPIVLALNGVASETLALRYFGRAYGACVWMWAAHLVPGEVILEGVPDSGMFHLGRVPAGLTDQADRALLAEIAADWTAAKLVTRLPTDVMEWKYRKLLSNIGNSLQALCGDADGLEPLITAAVAEGRRVLAAAGIGYTGDEEEAAARADAFTVEAVPGTPGLFGGSTWQSMARGTGNVETDFLNGEIALIARLHGQEAPLNARLAALTRQAARRGDPPGSLSPAELGVALGIG
jgi:2-dehydropantoate 2-reductase